MGRFLVNEALSKIKVSKNMGGLCGPSSHYDGTKNFDSIFSHLRDIFALQK